MSYNCTTVSTLFLIVILLFAAANPVAHGQGFSLTNPRGLTVTGQVCCTTDGNCPGGPGVAGAVVSLSCPILFGFSTQNTTDANGFFNISVPSVPGFLVFTRIIPCTATVQLPVASANCSALATNGRLISVIQSVGPIIDIIFGTGVVNAIIIRFLRLFI